MEQLIINRAKDLFFSYGLKSVSMDDLAKTAGISKKTIYQSVSDKTELIKKVAEDLICCHKDQLIRSAKEAVNAIEEVYLQSHTSFVMLASVNTNFFYELEKFFPAVWKKLTDHRQHHVYAAIVNNLERGIEEENYREDIEPSFLANMRLQQITTALNPVLFPGKKMEGSKLMQELTLFYLHGIGTPKGKKLIDKYFKGKQ